MKYSRQTFAHLLVASCLLAPKSFFATAQSDSCPGAAPGSCAYDCDSDETNLLCGSSSILPPLVKENLKEMKIQQRKYSSSNDGKVTSYFSFVLGPNQDFEYMKTQIKTFLSSVDIKAEVFDEEENGNTFGINLSGVSLETLPYSPFELVYFLEKEFSFKKAEPRLSFHGGFSEPRLSSNGDLSANFWSKKNVCDGDNKEWHLEHVKAIEAWNYSELQGKPSQGEGVVIAQIDTGYSDHDGVFTDDVWINTSNKGMNMFEDDEDKNDPKDLMTSVVLAPGHGTIVAAAAVGRGNVAMRNYDGAKSAGGGYPRGTAPKAKLYSIRAVNNPVIDPNDAPRIIKAFEKILELKDINVDVISMSLGVPGLSSKVQKNLEDKIKKVITEKNIIVVAAGGQYALHSRFPVVLPARFDDVIAVGGYCTEWALISNDKKFRDRIMRWWWPAQTGKTIDISGPANNVCNAKVYKKKKGKNPYTYAEGEGTSLATAMTGGIAALWLAHHGKANLTQYFGEDDITLQDAFKAVLKLAANKENWRKKGKNNRYNDKLHGHGMIDAKKILEISLDNIRNEVLNVGHTRIASQDKALEEEPEDAATHEDMIDFLLEIGYDKDTLHPFQENTDDLEHFVTELVYMKSEDNVVMSSALRTKLGQD